MDSNERSTLLVSLTHYDNYFSKLSTSYAEVFVLIHLVCLCLPCCQLLVSMQMNLNALFSYFIQCIHNVFMPLKLFTWNFLHSLGSCKFKYLELAVFEDDTNHFPQKLYNKRKFFKHLFPKYSLQSQVSFGKLFSLSLTLSFLPRRSRFCTFFL